MFEFYKKSKKLLGMNSRNLEYIRPLNLKSAKRLADDKLLCKKTLKKAGLPVPKMIAKITNSEQIDSFDFKSLPPSFVLKPNFGFGGEGILVVYGKKKGHDDVWVKADRTPITVDDLKTHIRNILDGFYSLSGTNDVAFFEERIKLSKIFKPYSYKGMPDVRIIVFNGVPVMAMLRLATKASGGKANLHLGGIGCGIDIATGTTTTAILGQQSSRIIEYLPGSRLLLSGLKIPYWKDILKIAIEAQKVSDLGYLGADIAIDRDRGPVFLELNARPGLAIQVANLSGLKERLKKVADLKIKTVERGIRVGMDLFGGEVEEEVEGISGKRVIGTVEKVKLVGKEGKEIETEAKIDTGAGLSSIDPDLAEELGFKETIDKFQEENFPASLTPEEARAIDKEHKEELLKKIPDLADTTIIHSSHGTSYRPMIKINIIMDGLEIPAKVSVINRAHLKLPIIIGKRNLGKFLIDVNK